ncbi:MAG: PilZ domain-containing protein, partial [Nitrospirota bacterium]
MTVWEKRTVERSNNILVTYRRGGNSHDYLLGITNNCSHKGINLETGRLEYNPGEVLELTLKHPYSEFSIDVVGEIIWKTESWYKSTTGIKLRAMDQDTNAKMKDLMSQTINVHDSPPSLQKHMEQAKAMEEGKSVIPESAANAEMIISHQDSSSIPKEDVSLPADEKT